MSIIMKQCEAVRTGDKTETRRAVKPGETWDVERQAVLLPSGRVKWRVGKCYAVVPKMYQKSFGRIRITAIEKQPLHDIDNAAALREGILAVPMSMTIEPAYRSEVFMKDWRPTAQEAYQQLWDFINGKSKTHRWSANPLVWVIRFEYVGDIDR